MSKEERKNAAAAAIMQCERLYKETKNPFYVVDAIDAAGWGEFSVPAWAVDALLNAVRQTAANHREKGDRISIDVALGLVVKRGKSVPELEAHKAVVERKVFMLTKIIHACFDVSIPEACEAVYFAVDFEFANSLSETMWRPEEWPKKLPEGVSLEQLQRLDADGLQSLQRFASLRRHSKEVRKKVLSSDWWEITNGDRLGYSLERYIDRYHRSGTRQVPEAAGLMSSAMRLYWAGHSLLLSPYKCAAWIEPTGSSDSEFRFECATKLADFGRRPEFAAFLHDMGALL